MKNHLVIFLFAAIVQVIAQPITGDTERRNPIRGPWSKTLIDAWISAGFHPNDEQLPDHRGSLYTHVWFEHGNSDILDYIYQSWEEFKTEKKIIESCSDDTSNLHNLDDLNKKYGHRENTILHLYCRSDKIYIPPILWLIRYGANPDQPNKVGITPRDLLAGSDLQSLLE